MAAQMVVTGVRWEDALELFRLATCGPVSSSSSLPMPWLGSNSRSPPSSSCSLGELQSSGPPPDVALHHAGSDLCPPL
jgi:hypothetical protein